MDNETTPRRRDRLVSATPRQVAQACAFGQPMPQARVRLRIRRVSDGETVALVNDVPSGEIGRQTRSLRTLFDSEHYTLRVELLGFDSAGDAV